MIVVMKVGSSQDEISGVKKRIEVSGLTAHISQGIEYTVIGVLGQVFPELRDALELLPGVDQVIPVSKPYKLASREFHGMGESGLKLLAQAGKETQMPIITEVMSPDHVDLVAKYADILQIGARNMQNFVLLDEVGKIKKPVLLKRGLSSSIQEWLLAAEYVLAQGNEQVILCERGIRTFETYTRNTMDLSAIPIIEKVSHLPIVADPSHATGKWYLVSPLALAAVAAGADGLLIEVHPNPDMALADGPQSLTFDNFRLLMSQLLPIAKTRNRKLATPSTRNKP
jgi:3-deoxy-7-phosphoheptulonate synthase